MLEVCSILWNLIRLLCWFGTFQKKIQTANQTKYSIHFSPRKSNYQENFQKQLSCPVRPILLVPHIFVCISPVKACEKIRKTYCTHTHYLTITYIVILCYI